MAHRLPCRHALYARAKGRNGWFVPKVLEFEFSEHADGTPLISIRLFSRRESAVPPLEIVCSVAEWEAQVLAIQLKSNEERRGRSKDHPRTRPRAS
jgi:hypothetical protein